MENGIHEEYARLLERAKSGDDTAFAEIYQKSERLVYTTCYRILNNKENAEDAMQETYLALYNNINTIRDGQALVAWLSRTAYFKSCDLGDKLKNDISYDDAVASEDITEEADDDLESMPEKYISVKANRDIIDNILKNELSKEQYIATFLFYYNELQISEIVAMMHCPENTVKTRLKTSRAKIKSSIQSYEKINKVSLAGAGAAPFLTRFFVASANDLTLPVLGTLPIPAALGQMLTTGAQQGAQIGNIAQSAELGSMAQQAPAQLGNLAQQAPAQLGNLTQQAQLGSLAQSAGKAGSSAAKLGVLSSPIFKVGVIVTVAAAIAVPTAIIVGKNIKNTNKHPETTIHEYVPDESEEPEVTTTTETTPSSETEETASTVPEETTEKPSEPNESTETTPEESSKPTISGITVSDAINETFKDDEGKEHLIRIPQITIPEIDTGKINQRMKNNCYPAFADKNFTNVNYTYYESEKIISIFVYEDSLLTVDPVHLYNFDKRTGEELSNKQMLQLLGITVDEFSAMCNNAITKYIDAEVAKGGDRKSLEGQIPGDISSAYGMKIFTGNDGHLCLVTSVWDAAGKYYHRVTFDLASGELIALKPFDIVWLPVENPRE